MKESKSIKKSKKLKEFQRIEKNFEKFYGIKNLKKQEIKKIQIITKSQQIEEILKDQTKNIKN